jgi:hypothetical protein
MTPYQKRLLEQAVKKAKAEYKRLKNLLEPPTVKLTKKKHDNQLGFENQPPDATLPIQPPDAR